MRSCVSRLYCHHCVTDVSADNENVFVAFRIVIQAVIIDALSIDISSCGHKVAEHIGLKGTSLQSGNSDVVTEYTFCLKYQEPHDLTWPHMVFPKCNAFLEYSQFTILDQQVR